MNYDPESETSQKDQLSTRDRRQKKRRVQKQDQDNIQRESQRSSDVVTSSSREGVKSAVQSSRERLSFDAVNGNGEIDSGSNRKKKQIRKTSNDVDFSQERHINSEARRKKVKSSAQRIPRSVSEEVLALEGKFNAEEVRTRKVYKREKCETDPSNMMTIDCPPIGRKTQGARENRKKRKPRSVIVTSGEEDNYQGDMDGEISEIFQIDKEDIIPSSELNQSSASKINNVVIAPPSLPSQPLDIVFIEKKDGQGFVKEHKSRLNKIQERTDYAIQLLEDNKQYTTLDFVLKVHLGFRSLALMCHGLLAGLAISQCVFVYSLDNTSERTMLSNYHTLALPYQAVYYFLLAVCTVSIFDRYGNISPGWSQFFLRLLTRPSRALAIVAYLLALVFSVSLAQLDDRISMYTKIPSLWLTTDRLSTWKVINLLRVIGSVIGWLMVAIAPTDDQTAITIEASIDNENREVNNYEMDSLKSPSSIVTWDRINN